MLLIYSGEVTALDTILVEYCASKNQTMLIIPPDPSEFRTARYIADYYNSIGLKTQSLSATGYKNKDHLKNIIETSSVVYLMGGNTYEFLNFANSVELFHILAEFEAKGGIIAAESAGSITLSPSIATAGLPTSDPDDNYLGLHDLQGMGRIPFYISPHFNENSLTIEKDLSELQDLSNDTNRDVMLLKDGEGFVMIDDKICQFIGTKRFLRPESSITDFINKSNKVTDSLEV